MPMRLGRSSASTTSPWLVVGLGNPGDKYHSTRHNIGHMVADELVDRYGGSFRAHKTQNALATLRLGETREKVLVAKPATYMNLSGGPVRALTTFFKVRLDQLIVVHDELDIDFDRLRIKRGGGDGGHNGLKSITQCVGDKNYYRVRAGIGRPPEPWTYPATCSSLSIPPNARCYRCIYPQQLMPSKVSLLTA